MAKLFGSRVLIGTAALAAGLATAPAEAQISYSGAAINRYGYFFDTGTPGYEPGGAKGQIFEQRRDSGSGAAIGIDYEGRADDKSFFFLHNDYCVGICSVRSEAVISFTVFNGGSEDVDIRFDSLILPGHLARIGDDDSMAAGFGFSVARIAPSGFPETFYSASGIVTADRLELVPFQDDPANAFNEQRRTTGPRFDVLDWSATPISVELGTLAAQSRMTVEYRATYYATSSGPCDDLFLNCSGVQVVFGGPRTTGGGTEAAAFALMALDLPLRDAINREYDAFSVPYRFVESGTPYEPLPNSDPEPDLFYVGEFTPADSVPEPATWASMIAGFGLVGGLLRRRRNLAPGGAALA